MTQNTNKQKISVFIIVYNEEEAIERCLESVSWADEIIIVDSCSQDKTVEICKRHTDKIYQREFSDFADMKNFALSKVSNEWALSIDADEECTQELRAKIEEILNKPDTEVDGFFIKRKSRIFDRWFRFAGTQNDYQMRLFRAKAARYFQPIHEKVTISGKTSCIREPMLHYTYDTMADYMERLDRYTSLEAEFLFTKKEGFILLKLICLPFFRFVNLYVLNQGFRDGIQGFLFSVFSGFYDFAKYSKLIRLHFLKI